MFTGEFGNRVYSLFTEAISKRNFGIVQPLITLCPFLISNLYTTLTKVLGNNKLSIISL